MIGETILHYKILEKLGEGGMGEVYKAQDTKLDRFVALKFLPSQLTASEDDKARFIQEAKAASSMNHPNVCTIHSIEEYNSQIFISMEYIEGKTLRDKKDSLSEKQILEIGIQVAEGLAAAHEKGIVHRDIKPENIMVRKDGIVQIMDFGLAKLYKESNVSRLTKAGSTVGTMGYMSPEQVEGLDVDHRTDIFSLGVVLYELLAGESPFKGMHDTAIMYEIVNVDAPPISTIKEGFDPELDEIILECLEKDKDERCQSAKELAKDLRKVKKSTGHRKSRVYSVKTQTVNSKSRISEINKSGATTLRDIPVKSFFSSIFYNLKIFWFLAAIFFIATIILLVLSSKTEKEEKLVRKFEWQEDWDLIEISPDGKKLAYTQNNDFYVRWFDHIEPFKIQTDEHIETPLAWSPNSDQIAFYINSGNNQRQLRKVAASGGQSVLISTFSNNYRLCFWGDDDSLVFVENNNTFYKISANGGGFIKMYGGDTSLCKVEAGLATAYRLPGKNGMLLTINSGKQSKIVIQNEDGRKTIYSQPAGYDLGEAIYSTTGHIIYHRFTGNNAIHPDLWALPFDINTLQATAEPFLILAHAGWPDVTKNGDLFYDLEKSIASPTQRLVILTRNGAIIDSIGQPQTSIRWPALSPDGSKVIINGNDNGQYGIWMYDLNQKTPKTLILNGSVSHPVFTKDGRSIYYSNANEQDGTSRIYKFSLNGLGEPKRINHSEVDQFAPSLSLSNKYVLFSSNRKSSGADMYYQETGSSEVKALPKTDANEVFNMLSPDEKFMVFMSNKTGRTEIYITSFPEMALQRQVSIGGGLFPEWIGQYIYYVNFNNELMAVRVYTYGDEISISSSKTLFSGNQLGIQLFGNGGGKYIVTPDGQKIIAVRSPQSTKFYMVLVENWLEEFKNKK